jgi:fused signal recognition particle receptor
VKTATKLLEAARERVKKREIDDPAKLKAGLRQEIARIVSLGTPPGASREIAVGPARPWVIMVVGVNGSGKTTTVGKLAAKLGQSGLRVLLGAGDTFRAAAGEQLEVWAERVGAPVVRGKDGSDPASVCFEAVKRGVEEKVDVVLLDTAGRLHTKLPLMEELKKVKRVVDKALPGAPNDVLLVLEATNGQNAIAQARQFHEALGVTGIALTKLDGTAKGGVVIGISDELGIPVRYVGVGEKVADLRPFDPAEFVDALFA